MCQFAATNEEMSLVFSGGYELVKNCVFYTGNDGDEDAKGGKVLRLVTPRQYGQQLSSASIALCNI